MGGGAREPARGARAGNPFWCLGQLFQKYGDERLALAAYNGGQGNVDSWRAKGEPIQFRETRAYVERVEDLQQIYRSAWRSELYK